VGGEGGRAREVERGGGGGGGEGGGDHLDHLKPRTARNSEEFATQFAKQLL